MTEPSPLEAALRKLKEQEALAAQAERIGGIGTYIYDAVAMEAIWSRQLRRIYGLPDNDNPATVAEGLACVHPDDLPTFVATVRRSLATGAPCELEHRIRRKDGEIRQVHARGEVVQIDGYANPVLVGTVQDVTERHSSATLIQGQAARLRAMEAELLFHSRQSAMDTMASTMAHELNQPLAAIAFSAAVLQRAGPAKLADEQVREMIAIIKDNALRAGQIIQRLRDSVSGRPKQDRFTCEQVIHEAIRFSSIGCEGVRLALDLGGYELEGADRVQIQQVLVNLIRNGCQSVAGGADGCVTITAQLSPDRPDMLRVTVEDNGPGISEEVLPHLFTSGVSTKVQGMGLGLSICRTIIESHGGSISARNLERGACFTFEIPLGPRD